MYIPSACSASSYCTCHSRLHVQSCMLLLNTTTCQCHILMHDCACVMLALLTLFGCVAWLVLSTYVTGHITCNWLRSGQLLTTNRYPLLMNNKHYQVIIMMTCWLAGRGVYYYCCCLPASCCCLCTAVCMTSLRAVPLERSYCCRCMPSVVRWIHVPADVCMHVRAPANREQPPNQNFGIFTSVGW